jgi:hypothetical protein
MQFRTRLCWPSAACSASHMRPTCCCRSVQAIIFVLLFGCVFGGAIDTLGIEDYTDF